MHAIDAPPRHRTLTFTPPVGSAEGDLLQSFASLGGLPIAAGGALCVARKASVWLGAGNGGLVAFV